nr:Chain 8, nascent chain [Saccharomyces cerevisiae]
ESWMER